MFDVRVDPRGTGIHVRGPADGEAERFVPLKQLLPGQILRGAGEPTRIAAVAFDGEAGCGVELRDGRHHYVPARRLEIPQPEERRADLLLENAGQLLTGVADGPGDPLGVIEHGAVACYAGRVVAVGEVDTVRPRIELLPDAEVIDLAGRVLAPGLVDPHTHPVFAGDRAHEFALRARGASYQEIAAAGGGIRSTVEATRAASADALTRGCARRLWAMIDRGVTTVEGKSGYALTAEHELLLLEVLRELDPLLPIDISPTLLAAHIVPPEYEARRDAYVDLVCETILPAAAERGLAEACDVFCEEGAFTLEESRRILGKARALGLARRIHAEQFTNLGGAAMAAALGAVSADHLEAIDEAGIEAMARAGTVAVLLPGAALTLRCPWPPVAALRAAGVALALGTDLNPGTSMTDHLPLMMSLGCTQMGMTVEEAWQAVTIHAARAALRPDAGRIAVGGWADLVVFDAAHYAAVPYRLGANLARRVYHRGLLASRGEVGRA